MSEEKRYWSNFGELNDTPEHRMRMLRKEFKHNNGIQMPIEDLDTETLEQKDLSRRDFLKYLGFSTAAATVVASCKGPVHKAIPFFSQPEGIVPGKAYYYSTCYNSDGQVVPVVVKVREGRPVKLSGNELYSGTVGSTSARVQASVLSLYDVARLRAPKRRLNNSEWQDISEPDLSSIDREVMDTLAKAKGKIAVIANTINSPTARRVLKGFLEKYSADLFVYDAVSYSGTLMANELMYGSRALPTYHMEKVKVVFSVGADFLGGYLDCIGMSKDWAKTRKIDMQNLHMSKHYHIESLMSITGANADERWSVRPSEYPLIIKSLYDFLQKGQTNHSLPEPIKNVLPRIAQDLLAHKGHSLVLCGSNDKNIQLLTNAINELLNARENIIDWSCPVRTRQGNDELMNEFRNRLARNEFRALIIINEANPVYELPFGEEIAKNLKNVPLVLSTSTHLDETAGHANYIFPDAHYLESWGDVEISKGEYAFQQPTINPLFRTRNWQDSLLIWTGESIAWKNLLSSYWKEKLGSEDLYYSALQRGFYRESVDKPVLSFNQKIIQQAYADLSSTVQTNWELQLYEKSAIGSGKMANNPWLQEMPDPISKATWDNYAMIGPSLAEELGIVVDDDYEVFVDKPVIAMEVDGQKLELPVLVIPGVHAKVIGVALGYGRTESIGRSVIGVGKKVSHLAIFETGSGIRYNRAIQKLTKTDKKYPIAYTQTHNSYEGRDAVMRESTLLEFRQDQQMFLRKREELYKSYGNGVETEEQFRKNATLYGERAKNGVHWGVSIDLNACMGCGACVVSCNAENNVSVVGKKRVARSQEMHWLRIDRYFSGDVNQPEVVFQPMMCQHCNNAPCENVCPVGATMHSEEGLNHMAYNRCVGTRYCANNCPFKVRRFNWLDWNGADSFSDNQKSLVDSGELDSVVLDMNDSLTRMVLNPDVVNRSRGVIEKCSLCIQRLQAAKTKAKAEQRVIKDEDVVLACMEACPTDAIVFGNVNDPNSEIAKLRSETQKNRVFYVLEQLHILPNINYLAKIRNK